LQQCDQTVDHLGAGVVLLHRAHLGSSDGEVTSH
jgi:hypothetical protein